MILGKQQQQNKKKHPTLIIIKIKNIFSKFGKSFSAIYVYEMKYTFKIYSSECGKME